MRWRKGRDNPPPETPTGRDEADQQGLNEAHEALDRALSQWPEVNRVTEDMRGIRQRNHLAELADRAMGAHRR